MQSCKPTEAEIEAAYLTFVNGIQSNPGGEPILKVPSRLRLAVIERFEAYIEADRAENTVAGQIRKHERRIKRLRTLNPEAICA